VQLNYPHRIFPIAFAALILLISACERELNNPWDEKSTLNPNYWGPQNFQVEDVTITEKKLTWSYEDKNIEGFKIDRKKGDEPWKPGFQTFTKEIRSWNDTDIIPDPALTYSYRLYAFAGKNVSAETTADLRAEFPAPTNLIVTRNTMTSVALNWQDNSTGEEGFRIDRKQGTGNWELITQIAGTNYTDEAFELNTDVFYRIAAYYGQYYSDFAENSFNSQLPPPENLTITANSATSVILNWYYNISGHEGFEVERKIDNGSWFMLADDLNPDQNSFADDEINLNSHKYYYRINAYWRQYKSQAIYFPEVPFLCGIQILNDSRDGNQYETILIGNQCWMKENLKWLPSVSPSANGSNTSPYYYVYGYQGTSVSEAKATNNYQTYGVLYNWTSALNACPAGWHLPSDSEWAVFVVYLGGSSAAGGKMKTTDTTHWNSPNTGATNCSGFSGLPGGYRYADGYFDNIRLYGYWWSSTETSSTSAWSRRLLYSYSDVLRSSCSKDFGYSVRCLRN